MLLSQHLATSIGAWMAGSSFPPPPSALTLVWSTSLVKANGTNLTRTAEHAVTLTEPWSDPTAGVFAWNSNEFFVAGGSPENPPIQDIGIIRSSALLATIGGVGERMVFFVPWSDPPGGGIQVTMAGLAEGQLRLSLGHTNFSNTFAEAVLRWLGGGNGTMLSGPARPHLALSSTPIDPRTGSGLTEPSSGAGYARAPVSFRIPYVAGNNVTLAGRQDVVFPMATEPWQGVQFWALTAGPTGPVIMSGQLFLTPTTIEVGRSQKFVYAAHAEHPLDEMPILETTERRFRIARERFGIRIAMEPARTASGMLL